MLVELVWKVAVGQMVASNPGSSEPGFEARQMEAAGNSSTDESNLVFRQNVHIDR